eukprot:gene4097-4781_t
MGFKVWFSYEDEEVELSDLNLETTVSAIRKIIHEGKIFHFPYGTSQTDIQIGSLVGEKFEKYKARNTLGDIQYKVGDTLNVKVKKAKVSDNTSIPTLSLSIIENSERAIKWDYNPYTTTAQWTCSAILIRMEVVPFAEGAFRKAFHLQDLSKQEASGRRNVAKIGKKPTPRASYFEDVKMQLIAKKWADKYNENRPPKKIDFLTSCVLEFIDRTSGELICGVEPYVEGQYRKYNNNSGFVSNDERNTPQSFSHFTYEHSNHQLLIIDIQGVGDHYTDPQIHTYDGIGYGVGNLGQKGFEKFIDTHKCNAICQYLNLQMINPKSEKSDCGTVPRPDLILPDTSTERTETPSKVFEFKNKTLELVQTLKGHEGPVESICFNDQYLFSGSADHTIRVWDIKKLRCIFTLESHDKPVHTVVVNDKYLFSGSSDKTIKVWDLKTLECKITLEGHIRGVKTLCVSGQYIFSGSNDKTIKVWDLKTFRCNYTLKGHSKWVTAICIVGTNLYSGSYDKTIRVWSLKSLECTATLRGHERWVEYMAVSDRYLFSASDDNTIKVWDLDSLRCLTTLEGHNATVQCLALYEERRFLLSCSHDQTIRLWAWENLNSVMAAADDISRQNDENININN